MIRGTVLDAENRDPVIGATVRFIDFRDSSRITYAITDRNGFFQVEDIRGRGVRMRITSVGFAQLEQSVRLGMDQDLGEILLQSSTRELQNVDVQGTATRTEQRGDTTVYNADAYQTMPDATAEDLVGKMPGVVVQGNTVQAQGENVQQVLVDGRRFFSTDPSLALRSLPAEVVQRIEVFDQLSEQSQFTGVDDGNTQKTMNVVTRENMRQGQFGRVYGGYGYPDRYQAGGSVNFFNQEQRLALIGQSNNTNQQNFASEDILGVVGGGAGGRGRGGNFGGNRGDGGNGPDNFLLDARLGVATTHAAGLNYTDEWGEKTRVEATYFFNRQNNFTDQLLTQNYLVGPGGGQFYEEASEDTNINGNHRVTGRVEHTLNRNNSLVWRPILRVQSNTLANLLYGTTSVEGMLVNTTGSATEQEQQGFNTSHSLLWRHRFAKFGRTLSVDVSGGANQQQGVTNLLASNAFFQGPVTVVDTLDQQAQLGVLGYSLGAQVVFTEALDRGKLLTLEYGTDYQSTNREQLTRGYQALTEGYSLLDTALSNTFTNGYWTQRLGGGLMQRYEGGMLLVRVHYQYAQLVSDQEFPVSLSVQQPFHAVLPFAMWRYELSDDENLRVTYRATTQAPSATQLSPVIDNSNPLQWSVGNADLEQAFQHNLYARYARSMGESGRSFFVLLGGGYTQNYLTEGTFLAREDTVVYGVTLPGGQQLTVPINRDGYWNARAFMTYGTPIRSIKSNLNVNVGLTYSQTPGELNGRENTTLNTVGTAGLVLSSNISESVDFTLSTTTNYTLTGNAQVPQASSGLWNQVSAARFNWAFTDALVYRTTLTHQWFDGLSADLDQSYMLCNMSLGYRFLKDRRGELALSVYDLLNQNTALQRTVTDLYIEDVSTNALQRYLMLTFTYNLRAFGQVPEPPRREGPPPGMREPRF